MLGIKLKFGVEDVDLSVVGLWVAMEEDDTNSECAD